MERQTQHLFEFGPFRLDAAERLLRRDHHVVPLTPKAFETLLALVENSGHLLEKEELMKRVWPESFVEEANLAQQIFTLRKILGEENGTHYIETVPKHGYRFIAPVRTVRPAEPIAKNGTAFPAVEPARVLRIAPRLGWLLLAVGLILILYSGWRASRQAAAPPPAKITLVVLPFENLSGDPEQEYLGDGLTEEVISQISRIAPARLAVIARTTATRYKGTRLSAADIGQQLGVNYILESSVRREGDRLRVTSQLIETRNQTHVWAANYDRSVREVLPLQAELARTVASEIEATLLPPQPVERRDPRQVDPAAYESYLKGRYFWNKRIEDKARDYFRQAIAQDASYAPPYAALAETFAATNRFLMEAEGLPLVRKALQLDERLPEAHSAAATLWMSMYDWPAAEREITRALELDPNNVQAHVWNSSYLQSMGRAEESVAAAQRARELDPLSPLANHQVGVALYYARRYGQAIDYFKRALELDPGNNWARVRLIQTYILNGSLDRAEAEFEHAKAVGVGIHELRRANTYAAVGRLEPARAIVKTDLSSANSYDVAILYGLLGKKDRAFARLAKACEDRNYDIRFVKVDPRMDPLRSDPRYAGLLRCAGLAPR